MTTGTRPAPMQRRHPILALALVLLLAGACGGGGRADDPLVTRDRPVEAIYNDAADALEARQFARAVALFDEVERQHPYSSWAVNAKLMAAYAQYMRNNYTDAIAALDRFIRLHPANPNVAYAFYLRALSYYEQIADVQRDQRLTEQALAALTEVVNRFPETPYGRDARLKIDLARDHLAGRDMMIGRWYQRRNLHLAAVNRFRRVVEEHQTTSHVAEALHRMTESYLALGLGEEARRTAAVLGHNFPGSPWYQDSFALLVPGAEPAERDRPGMLARWWAAIF